MKKIKNVLLFYCLGVLISFTIIAIIHLNHFIFSEYFRYAHWSTIIKTSLISGAPFGLFIWAFLAAKFAPSPVDLKCILTLCKPIIGYYLMGSLLAFLTIIGIELYLYLFDANYYPSTSYMIFGFSVLLGIPIGFGYYILKK